MATLVNGKIDELDSLTVLVDELGDKHAKAVALLSELQKLEQADVQADSIVGFTTASNGGQLLEPTTLRKIIEIGRYRLICDKLEELTLLVSTGGKYQYDISEILRRLSRDGGMIKRFSDATDTETMQAALANGTAKVSDNFVTLIHVARK